MELRPENMPRDRGHPWPGTTVTYSFERPRLDILTPGELTVTLTDCVNREWGGFAQHKEENWPLDENTVCTSMDVHETWSNISKIRLPVGHTWGEKGELGYHFEYRLEFVRQGEDGPEIISADPVFWLASGSGLKEKLGRRFTEDLLLKHAVVDGVDEYAC